MPQLPPEQDPSHFANKPRRIRFPEIEFPSDALSVKRLRTIFPEEFDTGVGSLTDGYVNLFFPLDHEEPAQLVQLSEMISQERVLAEYSFYRALETHPDEILDTECHECADAARKELERSYQQFKLADSPEVARLLIQHVEDEGRQQGERDKSRPR
jgi:hypothetical protein